MPIKKKNKLPPSVSANGFPDLGFKSVYLKQRIVHSVKYWERPRPIGSPLRVTTVIAGETSRRGEDLAARPPRAGLGICSSVSLSLLYRPAPPRRQGVGGGGVRPGTTAGTYLSGGTWGVTSCKGPGPKPISSVCVACPAAAPPRRPDPVGSTRDGESPKGPLLPEELVRGQHQ